MVKLYIYLLIAILTCQIKLASGKDGTAPFFGIPDIRAIQSGRDYIENADRYPGFSLSCELPSRGIYNRHVHNAPVNAPTLVKSWTDLRTDILPNDMQQLALKNLRLGLRKINKNSYE